MSGALARGEAVAFPFDRLVRMKKVNGRWELAEDEPMRPYRVEFELDAAGYELLLGRPDPALAWQDRQNRPRNARTRIGPAAKDGSAEPRTVG